MTAVRTDAAYVKCASHRARAKLQSLCGDRAVPRMYWPKNGWPVHGFEIPSEMLDQALAITSVTRWRVPAGAELQSPW